MLTRWKNNQFNGGEVAGFVLGFGVIFSFITCMCTKKRNASAANAAASRVVAESQLNVINDKTGSI